jgi:hypothetical protein
LNCSGKKDHLSKDLVWVDFEWSSINLNGINYEKGAIEIPITLNGSEQEFFAQLDLGSSISMLYQTPIDTLVSQKKVRRYSIDNDSNNSSLMEEYFRINNTSMEFNGTKINKNRQLLKKGFGNVYDFLKKRQSENTIGTVGVDFFQDKILILDYPNKKLSVTDSLPKPFIDKAIWQKCKFNRGSPLISLTVNGQKLDVIFDTGSSLFALLTKKSIYENVTSDVMTPDTLSVPSFGRMLTIVGKPVSESIKFNEKKLPNDNAYFFVQQEIEQMFNQARIDGLTGNKLFLSNKIIIDFKNGRFRIQE